MLLPRLRFKGCDCHLSLTYALSLPCFLILKKPATILWVVLWRSPSNKGMSDLPPTSSDKLSFPVQQLLELNSANKHWVSLKWSLSRLTFWLHTWERPEPKYTHPDALLQKLREKEYVFFKPLSYCSNS